RLALGRRRQPVGGCPAQPPGSRFGGREGRVAAVTAREPAAVTARDSAAAVSAVAPAAAVTAPLVMKFGGSSFLDLDGYRRVAEYVARRVADEGRRAVVVVSAMSGTTGRLQETLREVHDAPPPAVSSMILTTGEVVSVALLTAVL